MDEITCPECGRPNLPEAEKCWYCQVPLVEKNDNPADAAFFTSGGESGAQAAQGSAAAQPPEEDIPAWLKRIRELKKADYPEEEPEGWRQDKLFAAGEDKKPSEPRPAFLARRGHDEEKGPEKPGIPPEQPPLAQPEAEEDTPEALVTPEAVSPAEPEPEPEDEIPDGVDVMYDTDTDDGGETLPDGFKPL